VSPRNSPIAGSIGKGQSAGEGQKKASETLRKPEMRSGKSTLGKPAQARPKTERDHKTRDMKLRPWRPQRDKIGGGEAKTYTGEGKIRSIFHKRQTDRAKRGGGTSEGSDKRPLSATMRTTTFADEKNPIDLIGT